MNSGPSRRFPEGARIAGTAPTMRMPQSRRETRFVDNDPPTERFLAAERRARSASLERRRLARHPAWNQGRLRPLTDNTLKRHAREQTSKQPRRGLRAEVHV